MYLLSIPASECNLQYDIYLEPCAKSKILYGLYKTIEHIKAKNCIYILEAEKAVLQLWNYGYKNCISTGGKELSQYQIDMILQGKAM